MFNRKIMRAIRGGKEGFSLLEVLIVSVIFSVIIVATLTMMAVGVDVEGSTMAMGSMEDRSRIVLERIIEELQGAIADTVVISATNDSIRFQINEGYAGGIMQESTVRELSFEYDTGEDGFGDDEVDNDSDGMIDEGVVERVVEDEFGAAADVAILTHWVKGYDYETSQPVKGLFFDMSGRNVTIRLWLQRKDAKGRLLQSVSETSIRIRN